MLKYLKVVLVGLVALTVRLPVALAGTGAEIPVIVMGEDSDLNSVGHGSDIFRRVISSIQEQMDRGDFYVIDEDMVATKLGWSIQARRSKRDLIQVIDLMQKSRDPQFQVKAMVVFQIRAMKQDMGFATKATIRVTGDIYDVESNRFLGSWELPEREFPAPRGCSGLCLEEAVGKNAREVAATVADVLRKKLSYLTQGNRRSDNSGPAGPGGAQIAGGGQANGDMPGLATTYAVTFKNFSTKDTLHITDVMEHDFPGYVTARAPTGDTTALNYGYVSTAPAQKLLKWMNQLLIEMNLDPDSQVKVQIEGSRIELDKLFDRAPDNAPPRSNRFN